MGRYRVGIAGLGGVGLLHGEDPLTRRRYRYPTHAAAFASHPRIELVAAADPRPARRALARRRHGVRGLYRDHRHMLEAERLDILSVCVPTAAHEVVVRDAVAAGVRLVFCEKPFTATPRAATALADLCRQRRVSLAVNYFRRFDAAHAQVRQLLRAGAIGRVQRARAVYGNGWTNVGSHVVNLLAWYLGRARWVAACRGADDDVDAVIGFGGNVLATVSACSFRYYRIVEVDILGTRGRIVIGNEGLDVAVYGVRPNREVSGARQLSPRPTRLAATVGEAFRRAVDVLVDALDAGRLLVPADALDTHRVLEAARTSAGRGGRRVPVVTPAAPRLLGYGRP
jgi:predicted dehydrogenase